MKQCLMILFSILIGCNIKKESLEEVPTNHFNFIEIQNELKNWNKDSLGCLRIRKPDIMLRITQQEGWHKLDSMQILKLLGEPNGRYGPFDQRSFIYFIGCGGKGKTSWHNFYLHISKDKTSFSISVN